jgi:hypothetical protein
MRGPKDLHRGRLGGGLAGAHLARSSGRRRRGFVGVRIAGRRVSNRTFLHVLEATIHGSRKGTRNRPTSTTTFPNGLEAPKENRGRPRHAPTDRAPPGPRSKMRTARDFPLHGGRGAPCQGFAIELRQFWGQVGERLDAQIAGLLIPCFDPRGHDSNPALHEVFVNTEVRHQGQVRLP